MTVKEITPGMIRTTEEIQADLWQMLNRVYSSCIEVLESGTYVPVEFTRPELRAVVDAAKQADKTLFALTPTHVYILHLAAVSNGVLLAEVAESDVRVIAKKTEETTND